MASDANPQMCHCSQNFIQNVVNGLTFQSKNVSPAADLRPVTPIWIFRVHSWINSVGEIEVLGHLGNRGYKQIRIGIQIIKSTIRFGINESEYCQTPA